jgi:transcriptional repressor NrdR
MRCPFCQHEELKVTDSRTVAETNSIRRRRECLACLRRFTTFETPDLTIQVLKKDGCYEDFSQEKILKGLDAACRHTAVSRDQVRMIAYQITSDLMERPQKEVTTKEIGEMVMKALQSSDTIAYIRFACVYRRFKHVDELMDALESIPVQDKEFHAVQQGNRGE